MDNIIVISQNLKLESLSVIKPEIIPGNVLIVSTQFLFENERDIINSIIGVRCEFVDFADLLSDEERQKCDEEAYDETLHDVNEYYNKIKFLKNDKIVKHLMGIYPCNNCLILSDDLGIDADVWETYNFRRIKGEYYYEEKLTKGSGLIFLCRTLVAIFRRIMQFVNNPIWQADYKGNKYLFFGSTNRIGYRMKLDFRRASKIENIKYLIDFLCCRFWGYMPKNRTIRMTTFHENGKWSLPDHPNMNVKKIQDGYLPPNYTSKYLVYFGKYTEFYTWDSIGRHTFEYHHLKNRIMPFRNKLYLPKPKYPQKVRKVLCVASGAGDWTAIKNRSDEDMMLWVFGKVAAIFPEIDFIYRCHPVWIHPQHQGVNSIKRAAAYYDWLNLPNLKLSGNIPNANQGGEFVLSYKRSSFEEDLKDVDIVFGEHSVSMLDAGFKNILFASCNVTGHRNFWEDITNLGFPHCESIEEIANLINAVTTESFHINYNRAINNFNVMTDKEE